MLSLGAWLPGEEAPPKAVPPSIEYWLGYLTRAHLKLKYN